MVVTNQSSSPAFGVILRDALPVEMAFVSAAPSQGSCDTLPASDAGAIVQCRLGDMAAGSSVTVTVVTQSLGSGTLVNLATVTSEQQETNNEDNGATAGVVVTEPPTIQVPQAPLADLAITKIVRPVALGVPAPLLGSTGQALAYISTVTNLGPATATDVTFTDLLGPGLTFVSAHPGQGAPCTATSAVSVS